jgi:hypothetical protein
MMQREAEVESAKKDAGRWKERFEAFLNKFKVHSYKYMRLPYVHMHAHALALCER